MEESVEHYVAQWKLHAAQVHCFARAEGSPLLEVRLLGRICYVFERTNPYLLPPGPATLIINPMTEQLTPTEAAAPGLEVIGLSRLKAWGRILFRQPHTHTVDTVVIDAGAPLVVSVLAGVPASETLGDMVVFASLAPVHGFAVPPERPAPAPSAAEML